MRQLLNTLYVTTEPSYLRLENDAVRLEVDGEKQGKLPLHHLGSIVCFGNVLVSPALLGRCADDGRAVVFMTRTGRFRGRVVGPRSGNVQLRQAQFDHADDPGASVELARAMVAGKLQNTRRILVRAAREANAPGDEEALRNASERLAYSIEELENAATLDVIRGIEGEAAKSYFAVLTRMIGEARRETFAMDGRNRRPPRDRFNAVLSFLYTLLLNDCNAAAEGVGLDYQMGFLHAPRSGRPSLGLDLMEELRAYVADRLALTLINRQQLVADDFREREGSGAVLLNEEGRKTTVVAYQERKKTEITHPFLEREMSIGMIPHVQARLLARTLRDDMDAYLPFLTR